jgi:hypothetical protein
MKGRNKGRLVSLGGVVGIAAVGGASAAKADGVFAKNWMLVQQDIREPEQKAVLLYREGKPRGQVPGRETLILSVKYEGAAGDFAWVVPVPSRPQVEKGDAKIFEELAALTAPKVEEGGEAMMTRFRAAGAGARMGVEVVERRPVGVYDVAILSASDEKALANWLKDNGYALPGDPEPVLKHYVEKGWYYVAMRIDVKRVEAELVEKLKAADPRIDSLEKAKEVMVQVAEEGILAQRRYNESRLKVFVDALGSGEAPPRWWAIGGQYEADMGDYSRWGKEDGQERPQWAAVGILGAGLRRDIGQLVTWSHLDIETLRASDPPPRFDNITSAEELLDELAAGDVRGGIPYEMSHLKRVQDSLRQAGRNGRSAEDSLPTEYQESLEAYWEEIQWGTASEVPKGEIAGWRLRRDIGEMLGGGQSQLQNSLKQGTLDPISLSFACDGPIYPLRMTSLNSGKTDILLYVLAEKRAKAEGLKVRYAGRVEKRPTGRVRTWAEAIVAATNANLPLEKLVETSWYGRGGKGEPFLTKLGGELGPMQMSDDLRIAYEDRSKPFIETISSPLSPAPMVRMRPLPLPRSVRQRLVRDVVAGSGAAFVVGVILTLVVMKRRRGKGAA